MKYGRKIKCLEIKGKKSGYQESEIRKENL